MTPQQQDPDNTTPDSSRKEVCPHFVKDFSSWIQEMLDECHTLQDCLRKSTENIPSLPVKRLMETQFSKEKNTEDAPTSSPLIDMSVLRIVHGYLLTGPLDRIRSYSSSSSGRNQILDILLVLNVLQVFLELSSPSRNQRGESEIGNRSESASTYSDIANKDVEEMTSQLLRGLTGVLCHSLEQQRNQKQITSENSQESTHLHTDQHEVESDGVDEYYERFFNQLDIVSLSTENKDSSVNKECRRAVAFLAWQALLRIGNVYVRTSPKILSPFWKTLSEITTAMEPIPQTLSLEALKALLHFLQQGNLKFVCSMATEASSREPSSSWSLLKLRLKTLIFFTNRVHFFLHRLSAVSPPRCRRTTRLLSQLTDQLALFHGLELHLPSKRHQKLFEILLLKNSRHTHTLRTAGVKARQCFKAISKTSAGENVVTKLMVSSSLQTVTSTSWLLQDDNVLNKEQFERAKRKVVDTIALGKASFLVDALQTTLASAKEKVDDIDETEERLLLMTRAVLFHTFPVCLKMHVLARKHRRRKVRKAHRNSDKAHQRDLKPSYLGVRFCDRSLNQSLSLLIETLRLVFSRRTRGHQTLRLHRLLISWLGVASNDEKGHPITLEVLKLIVLDMMVHEDSTKYNAIDFAKLIVHVFMDGRTCRKLRITTANVLRRFLLHSRNHTKNQSLIASQEHVLRCISDRVIHLVNRLQTCENKDKRVKRKRKRASQKNTEQLLREGDLSIVGKVLSLIPPSYFQEVTSQYKVSSCRDPRIAALAVYCNSSSDSFIPSYLRDLNMGSVKGKYEEALVVTCLQHISLSLWTDHHKHLAATQPMTNAELKKLVTLLFHVTKAGSDGTSMSMIVPTTVLAGIGRIIPSNLDDALMDSLTQTFKNLFRSSFGILVSMIVTALHRFSSQVPDKYKHKLPLCVPSSYKPMIQSRLQRKPYIPPSCVDSNPTKSQGRVRVKLQRRYVKNISDRERSRREKMQKFLTSSCPFPVISSLTITNGSYVMSMPTQGGRSATVVFAPGRESLMDIAYMLGEDNEESLSAAPIFRLQRPSLLHEGNTGCKLLLQPQSLED